MDPKTLIDVWDCTLGRRTLAATIEFHWLIRSVRDLAGAHTADKLASELEATGKARIDGASGWFEYEVEG